MLRLVCDIAAPPGIATARPQALVATASTGPAVPADRPRRVPVRKHVGAVRKKLIRRQNGLKTQNSGSSKTKTVRKTDNHFCLIGKNPPRTAAVDEVPAAARSKVRTR